MPISENINVYRVYVLKQRKGGSSNKSNAKTETKTSRATQIA